MSAPQNQKVLVSHELRIDTRTKLGEGEAEGCPRRELYLGRRCGALGRSATPLRERVPVRGAEAPAAACRPACPFLLAARRLAPAGPASSFGAVTLHGREPKSHTLKNDYHHGGETTVWTKCVPVAEPKRVNWNLGCNWMTL